MKKQRSKVKELVNLPKKTKDILFNISWQVLKITRYSLDFRMLNNAADMASGEAGYANADGTPITPKVLLWEEDIGSYFGHSTNLTEIHIDGFDYSTDKKLIKEIQWLDQKDERDRIAMNKMNRKNAKRVNDPELDRMLDEAENPPSYIKKPHHFLYSAGVSDYMLSEFGLTTGMGFGQQWWAFSVLKYRDHFLPLGAIESGMVIDIAKKSIDDNPNLSVLNLEDTIKREMHKDFYAMNPQCDIFKGI